MTEIVFHFVAYLPTVVVENSKLAACCGLIRQASDGESGHVRVRHEDVASDSAAGTTSYHASFPGKPEANMKKNRSEHFASYPVFSNIKFSGSVHIKRQTPMYHADQFGVATQFLTHIAC